MVRRVLAISGQPLDEPVAVDFDAYLAEEEHADEPLTIRVGNKLWDLPSALPASLALRALALKGRGKNAKVRPDEAAGMIRAVFGRDAVEILDLVPSPHLVALLEQVIGAYNQRAGTSEKAPAPTAGPPRARAKAKKKAARPD